jgi:hypothetical protein
MGKTVNKLAWAVSEGRRLKMAQPDARRRVLPQPRTTPVVRIVVDERPLTSAPKLSPRWPRVRATVHAIAVAAVVSSGMGAAWALGVFHGSLDVPQISVVEVARAGVLPRCAVYDPVKGVCK